MGRIFSAPGQSVHAIIVPWLDGPAGLAVHKSPMALATNGGCDLVIIHYGDGKGKTTAALGMAVRALGSGLRTSILQFIKQRETGEHRALSALSSDGIEILRLGTGFVREFPPPPEALAAAREGLDLARRKLTEGQYEMVVLDEIFAALEAGVVAEQDVHDLLDLRPADVHLVMTGRRAPESVIARADLVTEMRSVKHPLDRGQESVRGIDE